MGFVLYQKKKLWDCTKKEIYYGAIYQKRIDYAIKWPVCHVFMDILG
jgi:hypothetical protein